MLERSPDKLGVRAIRQQRICHGMSDLHPCKSECFAHTDHLTVDVDGVARSTGTLDVGCVDVCADACGVETVACDGKRADGVGKRSDAATVEGAETVEVVRTDRKRRTDQAGSGMGDVQLRNGDRVVTGRRLEAATDALDEAQTGRGLVHGHDRFDNRTDCAVVRTSDGTEAAMTACLCCGEQVVQAPSTKREASR